MPGRVPRRQAGEEELDELRAAPRGPATRPPTSGQRGSLAQIAVTNKPLDKGYPIKEQIREAFKVKGQAGKTMMAGVTAWAHRCCIPEFGRILPQYQDAIGGNPRRRALQRTRRSAGRPGQHTGRQDVRFPQTDRLDSVAVRGDSDIGLCG